MKQGTLITRIVMLVLFLGVAIYLGVYVVQGLQNPYRTVLTYAATVNDSVEATGFVVREEQVLPGGGVFSDIRPDEGEKVAKGEVVAVVYQNSAAADRKQELRTLSLELEQLDYALSRNDNAGDAGLLDAELTATLASLESAVSSGDLVGLEDTSLALRSLVLKRTDTYQTSAEALAGIQASRDEVTAQLKSLKAVSDQESTALYAPCAGTFSGLADGYESLLTPALLETILPSQLDALAKQPPAAPDAGTVGKLITDSTWSFVTALPTETANRLQVGDRIPAIFSRDFSGTVTMEVTRIGGAENGQCAVVLSSDRHLADTTLLRRQTVELVFQSFSGIRVPKEGLRVVTTTQTDEKTGVTTETQVNGVFVLVGAQAELKPVDIVREGADFYLVQG
ncbi:MAG: HlyD family efflux transporter periplasmic adaptor subunit, partial [Oscillospiraceae bacterium]